MLWFHSCSHSLCGTTTFIYSYNYVIIHKYLYNIMYAGIYYIYLYIQGHCWSCLANYVNQVRGWIVYTHYTPTSRIPNGLPNARFINVGISDHDRSMTEGWIIKNTYNCPSHSYARGQQNVSSLQVPHKLLHALVWLVRHIICSIYRERETKEICVLQ